MKLIVKTITHVTIGVILMFGSYISLNGHLGVGGGVAGGVIVALAFILYVLAYGSSKAEERLNRRLATVLLCTSSTLLLIIALLGYFGGYFFSNFLPKGDPLSMFSAGTIPLCNFCLMVFVASALFIVFINFTTFRVKVGGDM